MVPSFHILLCSRRELRWQSDRLKNVTATRSMEAFHYVSYIPYRGRLFELDGLKPRPIDHGACANSFAIFYGPPSPHNGQH